MTRSVLANNKAAFGAACFEKIFCEFFSYNMIILFAGEYIDVGSFPVVGEVPRYRACFYKLY